MKTLPRKGKYRMPEIIFETQTNTYKLVEQNGIFMFSKSDKFKPSDVMPEQTFYSPVARVNKYGRLELSMMHTIEYDGVI